MRKVSANVAAVVILLVTAGCAEEETATRVVGELASDRVEVGAEFSEPIVEIPVTDGQVVKAGDLLVRQDASRAEAAAREALAAMRQAQARLDELVRGPRAEQIAAARAGVAGAEKDLSFRQTEHERIRMLREQALASPDLLDRARAALDSAAARLDVERARLEERLAGTTVEELAQAEQAVELAAARLDAASLSVDRHTLTAPVDGIVDRRLYEVGERPQPGRPVMVILPGAQPHARVYVPEATRVRVTPGTQALVYVDGLAAPVAGRVRWVSSEAAFTPYFALTERDRGRLSYEAKIDLDRTESRLPDGVPVEVEFVPGAAAE